MWIYQGSTNSSSGEYISIIQYLWSAASKSEVFAKVVQSHRNVMSALTEAVQDTHQIKQSPVTRSQIVSWKGEWRIILLFLELYTFILKIMDDEEFFSLDRVELQDR